MEPRERLLGRLNKIGETLAGTGGGLALLGLGSVGTELDRLDDYSDLDFFVIVQPEWKRTFVEKLDWIEAVHRVVYAFQNSPDGYKLLFEDGIFCEFAVFEPDELAHIPFAEGRVVWKADGFDESLLLPLPHAERKMLNVEWQVGEALTNLYVGMCRYRRGEKLSAMRFVQGYAVDRVVELTGLIEKEQPGYPDRFTRERRYEQRFPITAEKMAEFTQGHERTPESARAILGFLETHFTVNLPIKRLILDLCEV